jgi:hypothetical protein
LWGDYKLNRSGKDGSATGAEQKKKEQIKMKLSTCRIGKI